MKTLLVAVGVIALVVVVGAGIFLATFNADQYRPLLEAEIQKATGSTTRLGKISLGWKGGPALSISGLALSEKEGSGEADLQAGLMAAHLRFAPLLQKKVSLSKITIRDLVLQLESDGQGPFRLRGFNPREGEKAPESGQGAGGPGQAFDLSIGKIDIENAILRVTDRSSAFPLALVVKDLDVAVRDVSLGGEMRVGSKAALFSDKQNVSFSSLVRLPGNGRPMAASKVRLDMDLGGWDLAEVSRQLPKLAGSGLQELRGKIQVDVPSIEMAPNGEPQMRAALDLTDGLVSLKSLPEPLRDVRAQIVYDTRTLVLESMAARLADGELTLRGSFDLKKQGMPLTFASTTRQLQLSKLMKPARPGRRSADALVADAPAVAGVLSTDLQGAVSLGAPGNQVRTLQSDGTVSLDGLTIHNFNLLREVFAKFSKIPGVLGVLEKQLPEVYRQRMTDSKTSFAPVRAQVRVRDGRLFMDQLALATQDMVLQGGLQMDLVDSMLAGQFVLRIHPQLSASAAQLAPPLQYFFNAQGEIQIPVAIQRFPDGRLVVQPDLSQALSRVLASRGEGLLGGGGSDPLAKLLSKI